MFYVSLFVQIFLKNYYVSASTSFEMIFHKSSHWSDNEFAEFEGPIQNLTEFTSCHWEKLSYFAARSSTIWSYCYYDENERSRLKCVQLYSLGDRTSYYMDIVYSLWVAGLGNKDLDIQVKIDKYQHRVWNHVCVVYSTINSSSSLFFNGQPAGTRTYDSLPIIPGTEYVVDYAFILGQEPDSLRGSFSSDQAFYGSISELNIWNKPIKKSIIKDLAAGTSFAKGNVVSWKRENFRFENIAVQDIQEERDFFHTRKKKYIIFPQKLLKNEATHICLEHGGSIVIPTSDKETKEVQDVLSKHAETCTSKNGLEVFSVPGCWLGLEKLESTWRKTDIEQLIFENKTYSKWRDDNWKAEHRGMCSRIHTDGLWTAEIKMECDALRLCTVCELSNTPVFSMKGLCRKTSPLQWNYYPIMNDSYQIDTYEGYKRYQSISLNGTEWKNEYKGELFKIRNVNSPIGRMEWEWLEKGCTNQVQERNLTFSHCNIQKHFTCDSGRCIDLRKRCNDIVDCADESDEYECKDVDIPQTYDKLKPPISSSNESLHVNIQIIIKNINQINTEKMMIDVSLEIKMGWKDSRLMFRNLPPLDGLKLIKPEISNKLWLPHDNLIYDNAIVGELDIAPDMQVSLKTNSTPPPVEIYQHREEFIYKGSNTPIQTTQTVRVKSACNFQFTKFPFDNHECAILMHMKDYVNTKIDLIGTNTSIRYIGGPIVGQFDVASSPYPYVIMTQHPQNLSTNNVLKIMLKLERRSINGIIQIITPSLVLWLCAFLTLQYDVNDLTNRNRTSVTALLVLVTLFGSINNKSDFPKTSGFKHIDVWFVWYLINIFLIICHHTVITKISKVKRNNTSPMLNYTSALTKQIVKDTEESEKDVTRMEMINRIMNLILFLLTLSFNVLYFLWETL